MSNYRPDIDGLRAIAVVPVVLFHAHLGPFAGGFVGVDVFFVISGYLIAGIILEAIDAGSFSIVGFYERRFRRLFPALFTVLAASTVAAWLLLLPKEFIAFGKSVAATSAFVSNFLFRSEAGYFDAPAELKPLLHTWSLAVEEQFYLIFPSLLVLMARFGRRGVTITLALIALVSFALSVIAVRYQPDVAFYLPHTRMWELMLGALLATDALPALAAPLSRGLLAVVGVVGIAASVLLYSESTEFPGVAALLPCLGAAFVIYSGRGGGSPVHVLLGARPMVYVGLISYSLYLWHWPVLVFARAISVQPLSIGATVALVVLSFALAHLSWRYVEAPFRAYPRRFSRKQVFTLGLSVTCVMLLAGGVIALTTAWPGRLPKDVAEIAAASDDVDMRFRKQCFNFKATAVSRGNLCTIGAPGNAPPGFIFWGDSHANALAPAIIGAATAAGQRGLFVGSGGCPPLLGVAKTRDRALVCEEFNRRVLQIIREDAQIHTVIIVARWVLMADGRRYLNESGPDIFIRDAQSTEVSIVENHAVFRRGLVRTLATLQAAGKRVVVVGPVPEVGFDVPTTLARGLWFHHSVQIAPSRAAFFARQQFVMDTFTALQRDYVFDLIQPYKTLCGAVTCRVVASGRPLYVDDNHLSVSGARLLIPQLREALQSDADGTRTVTF